MQQEDDVDLRAILENEFFVESDLLEIKFQITGRLHPLQIILKLILRSLSSNLFHKSSHRKILYHQGLHNYSLFPIVYIHSAHTI